LLRLVDHDHGFNTAHFRTQQRAQQECPHRHELICSRTVDAFNNGLWCKLMAMGRDGRAEQRLLVLEVSVDA